VQAPAVGRQKVFKDRPCKNRPRSIRVTSLQRRPPVRLTLVVEKEAESSNRSNLSVPGV